MATRRQSRTYAAAAAIATITLLASAGSARPKPKPKPAPVPEPEPEPASEFDEFIGGAAARYDVPESLVRAVIWVESRYDPDATSSAGAQGLMQLMPSTAKWLGVTDSFDPRQNIYGGTRLLRLDANLFDGDVVLVLAAYNAGAGNVKKYGGVPPFDETQKYVRKVLSKLYGGDPPDGWSPDRLSPWSGPVPPISG